ncbi:MAG TPA: anti-sigma factor [Mesorhizobium sp.]|jgi:anti-sigma-K factor RskA|nr:anti-sigma factor [Mesorhizobium sp.]
MNGLDDERELGGDDALAAEYVLGLLPAEERAAAAARIETDRGFAALVDAWDMRLAPLAAAYPEVDPPPAVRAALERALFGEGAGAPAVGGRESARPGLWGSLAFWRGLSAAALAALLIAVAVPLLSPPHALQDHEMVASLAPQGSDVHYVAVLDMSQGEVSLAHMSGEREAGSDFELWMIEGDSGPVSMGVIPVGETIQIRLTPEQRARLAAGAVLAISLEPQGGSPTGQPTGPVVATGDLRQI